MNEIAIVKKEIMEKEWAEKIQCCRKCEQAFCCWKEELVVLKHAERCKGKCADLFSCCYCLC